MNKQPVRFGLRQNLRYFSLRMSWLFVLVVAGATTAIGQEEKPSGDKDGSIIGGPLRNANDQLKPILNFRLNGGRLALDRESWEELDPVLIQKREDEIEKRIKRLVEQGMDAETVERFTKHFRESQSQDGVVLLFQSLADAGGKNGGSGQSGSGERLQVTFRREKLSGLISNSNGFVTFNITEQAKPFQSIWLTESKDGVLRIVLSGPEFLWVINQNSSGRIRFIDGGEQSKVYSADSFENLFKQNSSLDREDVYRVLDHWGLQMPLFPADVQVIKRVVKKIDALANWNTGELPELFKQLDSNSYKDRQSASDTLRVHLNSVKPAIKKKLEDDKLSPEARARLTAILNTDETPDRTDKLIDSRNLLESKGYLVSILPDLDQQTQKSVINHLKSITGADPGDTAQAWQTWLKENRD